MNWLPWPLIPKRQWPVIRFKDKRAIRSILPWSASKAFQEDAATSLQSEIREARFRSPSQESDPTLLNLSEGRQP
jgi:hypothetical protein